MALKEILAPVHTEIALLQQARTFLVTTGVPVRRIGRLKQQAAEHVLSKAAKKKRDLSPASQSAFFNRMTYADYFFAGT